jgi:hypothetical protein
MLGDLDKAADAYDINDTRRVALPASRTKSAEGSGENALIAHRFVYSSSNKRISASLGASSNLVVGPG